MTQFGSAPERRNAPRVRPVVETECRLPLRMRVRLLDISLDGALLAGEAQLPKGSATRVRMALGYRGFDADGEVRRIAEPQMNGTAAVGVSFMSMDEQSRRSLEEFVRRARS